MPMFFPRRPALAGSLILLAGTLALAGCNREPEEPVFEDNAVEEAENMTVAEPVENLTEAPPPITNAAPPAAPPPVISDEQQILDDAAAAGMTARLPANGPVANDTQAAE